MNVSMTLLEVHPLVRRAATSQAHKNGAEKRLICLLKIPLFLFLTCDLSEAAENKEAPKATSYSPDREKGEMAKAQTRQGKQEISAQ